MDWKSEYIVLYITGYYTTFMLFYRFPQSSTHTIHSFFSIEIRFLRNTPYCLSNQATSLHQVSWLPTELNSM